MVSRTMPGPLALVGSGEFLPAMAEVDADLLEGRPRRVAVIPTAAGPEGDASVDRWFGLAEGHYAGLDAEVVRVDVRARSQALDPAVADHLDGVGLVYLSGGNPAFLADTLRDTPLAHAIEQVWRAGAAVAGCSAGAMAMGTTTLSLRGKAVSGLGIAGPVATIPHFDRFGFANRIAGAMLHRATRDGATVVGIDEDTATVWDPTGDTWTVDGAAKAWLVTATGGRQEGFGHGQRIPLPTPPR